MTKENDPTKNAEVKLEDEESEDDDYEYDEEDAEEDEELDSDMEDNDGGDDDEYDDPLNAVSPKYGAPTINGIKSESESEEEDYDCIESEDCKPSARVLNLEDPEVHGPEDEMWENFHNEEYKIWKKNAPYLYDFLITSVLEWPTNTVEWIPEVTQNRDHTVHRMVIGTQTSCAWKNSLVFYRAHVPNFDMNNGINHRNIPSGHGTVTSKLESFVSIRHDGDINRARTMPQNHFMIATKSADNNAYLFDFSKHSNEKQSDNARPELIMKGHTDEGFGLSWCPNTEGLLVSGSIDGKICLWNVNQKPSPDTPNTIKPLHCLDSSQKKVHDTQWHVFHNELFAAVGEKGIQMWDMRSLNNGPTSFIHNAHNSLSVNCVSFNPFSSYIFLTGADDNNIGLWDIRNMSIMTHSFECHKDEVYTVTWSPHKETIFASGSKDNRVLIWDVTKIGATQSAEDAKEGPPEFVFSHGGHTASLSDVCWNPNQEFMLASVAENNCLHMWKPGEHTIG